MTLAEIILDKSRDLPEEKAREVIDFIDFLKSRCRPAAEDTEQEAPRCAARQELARANLHWNGKPIPDRDTFHDTVRD